VVTWTVVVMLWMKAMNIATAQHQQEGGGDGQLRHELLDVVVRTANRPEHREGVHE
jgi:hypothetical protein